MYLYMYWINYIYTRMLVISLIYTTSCKKMSNGDIGVLSSQGGDLSSIQTLNFNLPTWKQDVFVKLPNGGGGRITVGEMNLASNIWIYTRDTQII